jgi:hypothetical protein
MWIKCTFTPQAWVNDYAISVDPEGPTEWEMEFAGTELPDDNSYESDDLRDSPEAPDWVREWSGPFYVSVELLESVQ